jgi:hypothetical protein
MIDTPTTRKSSAGWWLATVLMLPILYVLSCGPVYGYERWKVENSTAVVITGGLDPMLRYVYPAIRAAGITPVTDWAFAKYLEMWDWILTR